MPDSDGETLPAPASPRPHAGHALLFAARHIPRRAWWWAAAAVVLGAGAIVAVLTLTSFDWAALVARIERLPSVPLIAAMAVLPIFAFPILPVYLVAGARFGPWGGGVVITFATIVHLLGTYLIGHSVLRPHLQRLLARWHAPQPDIPRDEEAAVALIAALVPGVPYAARNYLFALLGLRLRIYFWIALPISVARSYVSILLGHLGTAPSRHRLFILLGVELLKAAICAFVLWRLRVHHRRVHGAPPARA